MRKCGVEKLEEALQSLKPECDQGFQRGYPELEQYPAPDRDFQPSGVPAGWQCLPDSVVKRVVSLQICTPRNRAFFWPIVRRTSADDGCIIARSVAQDLHLSWTSRMGLPWPTTVFRYELG